MLTAAAVATMLGLKPRTATAQSAR